MLSRELQVVERARVHRRQNNSAPCPNGNGTTIGTAQEFTVLCNTNLNGDVLNRLDASDFTACVDLCSSFHPKCEGASFDGSRCTLRTRLLPDNQRFSRRSESAIAEFPGASSNCATLGGAQQALGASFTTMCGFIIDGNDISQNFAPTFQDCLGQCATTSGCAAVSFDPSQDLGFKNCYLKTTVSNPRAVAADRRTDSAILAAAAPAAPSDDASSAAPPTADPAATSPPEPSPAGPGVSTLPLPSSVVPANGGAVFFTPPGGVNSAAVPFTVTPGASTPVPTPDFPPAPATTDLATAPSSSLALGSAPFLFPTPSIPPAVSSTEAAPDAAGQNAGDGSPSMAWVAAPVVGGVAAIALIGVSFVMLRRRRRGFGGRGGSEKAGGGSRPSAALLGRLAGWLPVSLWSSSSPPREGNSLGGGRKMTGMGNFSEVESGRRSAEARGSVRNSVVGFMTGRPMGMERLEDIEEGDGRSGSSREGRGKRRDSMPAASEVRSGRTTELRTSFNGLGQNKWLQ
ncbi:hypothetical protein C8A01DRAFT_18505 [Parachaetomium inaequale]|uniref:Apple domain-containing protein n=1 Tax=Parachaetomium inaequale TaxID=2588326 RepID=A0AAN6SPB0_9PEZI|nr:hypothetical protein C8A01DRAFT_18505 [Parachaetomium inaequale]